MADYIPSHARVNFEPTSSCVKEATSHESCDALKRNQFTCSSILVTFYATLVVINVKRMYSVKRTWNCRHRARQPPWIRVLLRNTRHGLKVIHQGKLTGHASEVQHDGVTQSNAGYRLQNAGRLKQNKCVHKAAAMDVWATLLKRTTVQWPTSQCLNRRV